MNATTTYDEFDFTNDSADLVPRDRNGRLQGDERLHVTFTKQAMKSELKSAEQGRAVFDDIDFIRILVPGDKHTQIFQPATPEYQVRFPVEWERYQKKVSQEMESGTPLTHWKGLTPSQIAEFRHLNVRTVEDLAGLSDDFASKVMGGAGLRDKALKFLNGSVAQVERARQDGELAKRDAEIAELKRMVAELATNKKAAPKEQ